MPVAVAALQLDAMPGLLTWLHTPHGKRHFPSQGRISKSAGLVVREVHLLSSLVQTQQVLRTRCLKAS